MAGGNARPDDDAVTADDLSLVDDRLEDEGKDDAALWAELETGEQAASDDDAAPSPDDKSGDGGDDDAASADFGSGDDSAAAGGDDDSSSTAQRQPDDKSGADGKTPSGNDDQIWANATQEQRAAFDAAQSELARLKHAERSNRGRISALQRQLQDVTRQSGRQSPAGASGGQAAPGGAAGSDFFKGSKWSEFRSEYPEIAGPLEGVIGDLRSQNTRLEKELSAIGDERRQSALDEQEGLLVGEHPDWEDLLTVENGFPEWLESQPRHIQEAAARNGKEIVDASEAADVVGRFKEFVQAKKGGDSSAGNRNGAGNGAGNQSRLSGRRARQLESASSARANGPGVASGIAEDGDPEVIWDQFDKAERREARG